MVEIRKLLVVTVSIFAAVGSVAPSTAQSISEQAKAQLTKGEQLLSAGDLSGAQTELQKVIDGYPTTEWVWWARVRLSECYYHQRHFDDCILEARKVVNLYPSAAPQLATAWAQLNVGLAYRGKGDVDSALWEMERVEQILGDNPDRGPLLAAKRNMALAHHSRNNRKKSLALAKEILSEPKATDQDRAWAHFIWGAALVGDKKTDEGLAELRKVKNEFPGLQEQVLNAERKILEHQYLARHDYDGAVKEAKAIASDPSACEARAQQARYFAALACLYKKDYTAAIAETQAFLDKYSGPAGNRCQILAIQARAYAMKKDYAQAITRLEAALATNPQDAEFCAVAEWDVATCCRAMGDTAGANARYQRLIDLYPQSHLSLRAAKALGR